MTTQTAGAIDVRGLRIVGHTEDYAAATLENYVLLLWRRKISLQGAQSAHKGFLQIRQSMPDVKIGFLTVVEAQCDISTPSDVRKDIADLLSSYSGRIAAAAIIFEGHGFKMTLVRSIITAINIASRKSFPNSVFGEVDAASTWMQSHSRLTGSTILASELVRGVAHLRQL